MVDLKEKIKDIFGTHSAVEASYKVEAIATHFKDTSNIYIPETPLNKLQPGMQLIKDAKKLHRIKKQAQSNETNFDRSMRRSIQRGKHIIRCNTFDWFVTFTFAKDRHDIDLCRRKMETWLENQKKRTGRFEYIVVVEYHKDGAPHFHALFKGYKGKIVPAINPKTNKQLRKKGRLVFDLPSYTLGHVYAYQCDTTQKDSQILQYYLNKLQEYLNKDETPLNGKKRYWYTRGLKKPVKEYNPIWFDLNVEPIFVSNNEWGETRIYTTDQIEQMKSQFEPKVA